MHRALFVIVCAAIYTMACNSAAPGDTAAERKNGFTPQLKTKEDSLYHDVMEGHDAGMAKLGKLRGNIDKVQHLLDSIKALPPKRPERVARYNDTLELLHKKLTDANNEMMAWMDHFKVDSAADNKDVRIQYLQSEKEKVTLVKEHILSSLQLADSVLKK
jgi:hypothetical protein